MKLIFEIYHQFTMLQIGLQRLVTPSETDQASLSQRMDILAMTPYIFTCFLPGLITL